MDFKVLLLFTCISKLCNSQEDEVINVDWFLNQLPPVPLPAAWPQPQGSRLSRQNVVKEAITVSGFGMGGCFAQQMFLSHSNILSGCALYRPHGVYTCGSGGDLSTYLRGCVQQKHYDYDELVATAESYSKSGLIEPLEKLSQVPLFYHFGTENEAFSVLPYIDTFRFWSRYIKNPDLIYSKMLDSDFLVPTDDAGGPCDKPAKDTYYVGNCSYHVPYTALKFLLEKYVDVKRASKLDNMRQSPITFSQSEFFGGLTTESTGMAENGLIYIPLNCQFPQTRCYLHIHFHDLLTAAAYNGANHYKASGLFGFAERNNIIMLFPQAQKTSRVQLDSWDCFGSTGEFFATKNGTQIQIVKRMIDRIKGE